MNIYIYIYNKYYMKHQLLDILMTYDLFTNDYMFFYRWN